ncbi:MAG: TonB-dependent receptor [Prolixibacteraceae bacterium]|nr:TonB-dependent receptor [Prolixibacteraceae bacterium]
MKKNDGIPFPFRESISKFIRVMKLMSFLLLAGFLEVSANAYSQKANINLSMHDVRLDEVIKAIQQQTEFTFFYSPDDIADVIFTKIEMEKASLEKALDQCLKGTNLDYEIVHKAVILKKGKEPGVESLDVPALQQPQKKQLKGKVTDSKGGPIPGTTVLVKGTTIGTITDGDGNFTLDVPLDAKILAISFVGMKTQEIIIGGKTTINLVMQEETVDLDEVVAVGYGVQKKVSVTGAVASIQTKELTQSSSASLANALAGRLPGLTSIQSGGGRPGRDDATMYLRGASTTNGRSPLILIDGVPRDNIRTIDANEVASVSILKDASATALFGVRGANGVILITTKRGVEGKPELTVNAVQSYASFTREPERLHSVDYIKLRNEASANDNISPLPFSQAAMDKYANPLIGLDPNDPDYTQKAMVRNYMYPDHNYYRELISRSAPSTRINVNASGGTDKVTYFINAAYLHQGGNMKVEPKSVLGYDPAYKMDRFNFRANLDYKVTKSLKSFLNIGSYIEQVNMPSAFRHGNDPNYTVRDLLYQAQNLIPITPGPTTIAGFGVAPGQIVDPGYISQSVFEIMNRLGYRNEVSSNLNSSFGLDWDLGNTVTKGLSMKGMISYDSRSTTATQGSKLERLYLAEVDPVTDQLSYVVLRSDESLLSLSKGANSRYTINMQASINYKRLFGEKHDVGGMLLGQRDYWETTAGEIPFNVLGVAARATYGYDNRYLGEVNMGYNGSEQFAPGKRYGFFPAVSAGWVASNEDFLKENPIITNLKFRASYGKVGNDQMGSARFLYQSNISLGAGPLGSLGLGRGISQGLLGNPNISWEVAKKQNYGVDLQLLKSLGISFDYFLENRSQILISRGTIPEFQGVLLSNIPRVNMGLVDNRGYEIELTYNKPLAKDLSLMLRGNYGYNHNIVKFLDEVIRDESYISRYTATGYSLGQPFGYKIDYSNGNGYFNSRQELDDYLAKTTYGFGAPRVGDFKYLDLNGDGVISDKDQVAIGNSNIPGVSYGLTLNLQYKSFDFTTFFQGVGKYSSNYANQGVYEYSLKGEYFDYHKSAWTPERYANGEKITYPALSTHINTNHTANDFFIMDRSFIRLKNIELVYTLPKGALKVLGVQSLRVFVSAQNLFTWDNLRMGHLDPENNDPVGYPQTRMINFGTSITF